MSYSCHILVHFAACLGILCLAFTLIKGVSSVFFLVGSLYTWAKRLPSLLFMLFLLFMFLVFFLLKVSCGHPLGLPFCASYRGDFF